MFFRGELFKILTFWGLAGVRFLFLSEFYLKISTCSPSKKTYFGRPPARSETGSGILSKFWCRTDLFYTKIFKNIQKPISSSGVCQGHSTLFSRASADGRSKERGDAADGGAGIAQNCRRLSL
jgi:hypothetical protein